MAEQEGRRTQQERRAEAEKRVVAAAVRLIAEKGSRAVTLGEVGREAGYSRGIVHLHFGSREQLPAAVVREAQDFDVPEVSADPVLGPLFAERDTAFRADLARYVHQGIADGSVRADADADATAALLVGMLRGLGMQLLSSTGSAVAADIAARTVDFVQAALADRARPTERVGG